MYGKRSKKQRFKSKQSSQNNTQSHCARAKEMPLHQSKGGRSQKCYSPCFISEQKSSVSSPAPEAALYPQAPVMLFRFGGAGPLLLSSVTLHPLSFPPPSSSIPTPSFLQLVAFLYLTQILSFHMELDIGKMLISAICLVPWKCLLCFRNKSSEISLGVSEPAFQFLSI